MFFVWRERGKGLNQVRLNQDLPLPNKSIFKGPSSFSFSAPSKLCGKLTSDKKIFLEEAPREFNSKNFVLFDSSPIPCIFEFAEN